jgi:hypothetical protein
MQSAGFGWRDGSGNLVGTLSNQSHAGCFRMDCAGPPEARQVVLRVDGVAAELPCTSDSYIDLSAVPGELLMRAAQRCWTAARYLRCRALCAVHVVPPQAVLSGRCRSMYNSCIEGWTAQQAVKYGSCA